jgi:hypothetical protein
MLQAAIGECLAFDTFAFEADALGASKIDVSRREIAQALVIAGSCGPEAFPVGGLVGVLMHRGVAGPRGYIYAYMPRVA